MIKTRWLFFPLLNLNPARHSFLVLVLVLFMPFTPKYQQKYSLKFSPAVGKSLLYMLNTSVHVKGKDFSGKEIDLGATASGEISFAIQRAVQDIVFAGITTPGLHVEAQTLKGPETYTLNTKPDMAVQASFDQMGYVRDIHNLEALTQDRIWNISLAQILKEYLPGLPGKSVSIGDSWQDNKLFKIPYQGMDLEISMDRTYFLQNLLPSQDGDLAIISIDYQVTLSGAKKWEGWTGLFEGTGTGQGMFNFHLQRNCIQEFNAEYQTDAAFKIIREGKTFQEWPFQLIVSASLRPTRSEVPHLHGPSPYIWGRANLTSLLFF